VDVEVEEAGSYRLRFSYRVGSSGQREESLRVIAGGRSYDFLDSALENTNHWEKSRWLRIELEEGLNAIEFLSIGRDSVGLERLELERDCEEDG
jgi:hypothetical protein